MGCFQTPPERRRRGAREPHGGGVGARAPDLTTECMGRRETVQAIEVPAAAPLVAARRGRTGNALTCIWFRRAAASPETFGARARTARCRTDRKRERFVCGSAATLLWNASVVRCDRPSGRDKPRIAPRAQCRPGHQAPLALDCASKRAFRCVAGAVARCPRSRSVRGSSRDGDAAQRRAAVRERHSCRRERPDARMQTTRWHRRCTARSPEDVRAAAGRPAASMSRHDRLR